MLRGVNDTLEDAKRLGALLKKVYCAVNLIVFNPHEGTLFQASHMADVVAFRDLVRSSGKLCTIRDSRGDDEMAACGQLGKPTSRPAPILKPPARFRESFAAAAALAGACS
jgi:23S rRNA (adenine2503-C2)-methyltransferase